MVIIRNQFNNYVISTFANDEIELNSNIKRVYNTVVIIINKFDIHDSSTFTKDKTALTTNTTEVNKNCGECNT